MKTNIADGFILIFALVTILSGCNAHPETTSPSAQSRPRIEAPFRKGIVLDGNLEDWSGIAFLSVRPENGVFDGESTPADSSEDLRYRFALCYDSDALYVAVEVVDDVLKVDTTSPGETSALAWKDDAVEVFIDGNQNRAPDARDSEGKEYAYGGEFSLVLNGAATSNCTGWPKSFGQADRWQGATNFQAVKNGKAKRYCYEYRLTWNVMGGHKQPGDTIGFTIGVQDDDDGGDRDHALYWCGRSPHCWKDEAGWGDVRLSEPAPQPE